MENLELACPVCREAFMLFGQTTDMCLTCLNCFMCCTCPDDRTPEQKEMGERALERAFAEAGIPWEPRPRPL